jgi:hypothetical protein
MAYRQDYHCSINIIPQRMIGSILACFQPVYNPGIFLFSQSLEPNTFQINCQKWGDIGCVACYETQPGKTELRFEPPKSIAPDTVRSYEKLIRDECLHNKPMLAELYGQDEIVFNTLTQALYEKRLERQQEFITWLLDCLQTFGYRDIDMPISGKEQDSIGKIIQYFDFPIIGTPAQLGVMILQFTASLRNQPEYQKLLCQVVLPGSKETLNIPADANPVEVKVKFAKNQISINAHLLPTDGSFLRVQLKGNKNTWIIWDKIRDELEKLGWFTLPENPEQTTSLDIKIEPQPVEKTDSEEVWVTIPNIGANRDIIRYWHQGLTCSQIGTRVGLTEKTVLNRINKLRNEYGLQVVPYRKSKFIKKSKDLPS